MSLARRGGGGGERPNFRRARASITRVPNNALRRGPASPVRQISPGSNMQLLNFAGNAIPINLLLFGLAAGVVWRAGTRLTHYADQIATRTGIGRAVIGLVLLGGITSLPEMAVAVFAALSGAPAMAVNNLVGGIAMQKAILAGADGFIGKEALTVIVASPGLLLQAVFAILLLVLVAMAMVAGDTTIAGVGLWAWLILAAYGFSVWTIAAAEKRPAWAVLRDGKPVLPAPSAPGPDPASTASLPRLAMGTGVAAVLIFIAGYFLSTIADVLAGQTGLGRNLVGAILLALATSLPELSTVTAALRLRQYEMAIADIQGTSMFNLVLIALIDALYAGPAVLGIVGNFTLLATLLCILMGTIYLIGLIERSNRTIARFGVDSIVILLCYIGGLYLLFQLR